MRSRSSYTAKVLQLWVITVVALWMVADAMSRAGGAK